MGAANQRRDRRHWRNLLLDKGIQLRFTLLTVAIAAVLMTVLGFWVMHEAREATIVGETNVLGQACPLRPELEEPMPTGSEVRVGEPPVAPKRGKRSARPRSRVLETTVESIAPPVSPEHLGQLVQHHECRSAQAVRIRELHDGYRRIQWTLGVCGVLLCVGLGLYGIKMTHRVAGPLYKLGFYFEELENGRFNTMNDLRRGDQLVSFYQRFRTAHERLRVMEEEDLEFLRELLDTATEARLASRSPELAAVLEEVRVMVARKEASVD